MYIGWLAQVRRSGWVVIAGLLLAGCARESGERLGHPEEGRSIAAGSLDPNAPPETVQFGQLIGAWEARQVSRTRDGSWSADTSRADWTWRYILGGHAIEDECIAPPLSDTASHRFRGINVRIYDPAERCWHITWVDTKGRSFSQFTATGDSTKIVMKGVDARGRLARNIFSEITASSFSWTKEWTFDQGATWVPVSRIFCRRKD